MPYIGFWDFIVTSTKIRYSCDEIHVEVGIIIFLEVKGEEGITGHRRRSRKLLYKILSLDGSGIVHRLVS